MARQARAYQIPDLLQNYIIHSIKKRVQPKIKHAKLYIVDSQSASVPTVLRLDITQTQSICRCGLQQEPPTFDCQFNLYQRDARHKKIKLPPFESPDFDPSKIEAFLVQTYALWWELSQCKKRYIRATDKGFKAINQSERVVGYPTNAW